MSKQPFYGDLGLLITTDVLLSQEDIKACVSGVTKILEKRLGKRCIISVEENGYDGQWGDPCDI